MNSSRDKILFWCLIFAEAAGSQAILWNGIPIYRRGTIYFNNTGERIRPGMAGASVLQ